PGNPAPLAPLQPETRGLPPGSLRAHSAPDLLAGEPSRAALTGGGPWRSRRRPSRGQDPLAGRKRPPRRAMVFRLLPARPPADLVHGARPRWSMRKADEVSDRGPDTAGSRAPPPGPTQWFPARLLRAAAACPSTIRTTRSPARKYRCAASPLCRPVARG